MVSECSVAAVVRANAARGAATNEAITETPTQRAVFDRRLIEAVAATR